MCLWVLESAFSRTGIAHGLCYQDKEKFPPPFSMSLSFPLREDISGVYQVNGMS